MRSVATRYKPRVHEHNLTLVAAGVAFYRSSPFVPALVASCRSTGWYANPADVTRQVQTYASALRRKCRTSSSSS